MFALTAGPDCESNRRSAGPGKVGSSRSRARPASSLGSLLRHPPPHYLSPTQDMIAWPGARGAATGSPDTVAIHGATPTAAQVQPCALRGMGAGLGGHLMRVRGRANPAGAPQSSWPGRKCAVMGGVRNRVS